MDGLPSTPAPLPPAISGRAGGISRRPALPARLAPGPAVDAEDFQRHVPEATSALPYGTVTSYAGIAVPSAPPLPYGRWRRRCAGIPCRSSPRAIASSAARAPSRLRGPACRSQATAARRGGRRHRDRARPAADPARGDVGARRRRARVLPAHVLRSPLGAARAAHAVRHGRAPRRWAWRRARAGDPTCIRCRRNHFFIHRCFHASPPPVSYAIGTSRSSGASDDPAAASEHQGGLT
jgi:hypothetical protein